MEILRDSADIHTKLALLFLTYTYGLANTIRSLTSKVNYVFFYSNTKDEDIE